jgi:hypothetical protein
VRRIILVCVLTLVLAPTAAAKFPIHGVLIPGKSLAGVQLGDTPAAVTKLWGSSYNVCTYCGAETTWFYIYPTPRIDMLYPNGTESYEPLGAAVRFRNARVSAVFTIGSPDGWRTAQGLLTHAEITDAISLYGVLNSVSCIGFGAMTIRAGNVVTSILTTGEAVYGFELSTPNEPVCP